MKLLIEIPGSNSVGIVVPSEFAAQAATLMASAKAMKSDGYGESQRWSPHPEALTISFIDNDRIAPLTDREKRLIKENEDQSSARWKAYSENEASKKTIAALEAQIELLKSVTVCQVVEPTEAVEEDYVAEQEEPF